MNHLSTNVQEASLSDGTQRLMLLDTYQLCDLKLVISP